MERSLGIGERLWDVSIWVILGVISLMIFIPLWYVLMISLTSFDVWAQQGNSLFVSPSALTLDAYARLFSSPRLPRAFGVSAFITILGTTVNLVFTTLMAYPLSKKRFALRNPILLMVLFTMLFNGGLVPTYLIVRDLGLLNTYWALILPGAISAFNLLVMKQFFQSLPIELEEAARIDGATEFQVFRRIVLPLSKPILATIGLFYAIGHWNAFFDALIYIRDSNMHPLQVVLRQLLSASLSEYVDARSVVPTNTQAVRMAAVVIAIIPVMVIYPFLQRYFTKGVLLGSVKE
jgi:putative aldouronate transport system permease protein